MLGDRDRASDLLVAEPRPDLLHPADRRGAAGGPAPRRSDQDAVAYALFTSGATGRPKDGVPIRRRNVLAFLDHCVVRYDVGPDDQM